MGGCIAVAIASGEDFHKNVEPSTSVSSNVTAPTGEGTVIRSILLMSTAGAPQHDEPTHPAGHPHSVPSQDLHVYGYEAHSQSAEHD